MKKQSLLGFILVSSIMLSVVSCKKKDDPTPAPSNNTNTNTNLGSGVSYNEGSVDSYTPTKRGSTWTYAGALNYTVTMGDDTIVNGIHYANIKNTRSPSGKGFMRIDGTDYYTGSFTPSLIKNMLNLKDAPEETTWNNDYPNLANGYDYRYTMTIDSVGLTTVVNSVVFSNVIKVKQEIYIDLKDGDGYDVWETDYYWYAKGIGFIKCDLESNGVTYLSSYNLN